MTQSNSSWKEPENWPDLPKSCQWILRIFLVSALGIIALVTAGLISTSADPMAQNELSFTRVPAIASTEIKLKAYAIHEVAWFNEDEIVIIGSFPNTGDMRHHHLKTYNKSTGTLTGYPSVKLDDLCLESNFSPLRFDSGHTIDGNLFFFGICRNSINVKEIYVDRLVFQNNDFKFLKWNRFLDSNFPSDGPKSLNYRHMFGFAVQPSEESMVYIDRFLGASIVNSRAMVLNHFNISGDYQFIPGSTIVWSPDGSTLASTAFAGDVHSTERFEPNIIQLLDINKDNDFQIKLSHIYDVDNLAWVGEHLTFSGEYQSLIGGWRLDAEEDQLWHYNLLLGKDQELVRKSDFEFSPEENWAFFISKDSKGSNYYLTINEYANIE